MVCKYCGFENENYIEFCVNCGAQLENNAVAENDSMQNNEDYGNDCNNGYNGGYGNAYENKMNYPEPAAQPRKKTDGMSIASMVLGILSIVSCYGGSMFSILGLILGIISFRKSKQAGEKNPYALTGIITSLVSTVFVAVCLVIYVITFGIALVAEGM